MISFSGTSEGHNIISLVFFRAYGTIAYDTTHSDSAVGTCIFVQ